MGQTDKLPDTENFTREVEDVIDDLFAPSRSIEIDPLTNEVKEKDESSEQPLDELSLELDITTDKKEGVQPPEHEELTVEGKTASSSSEPVEFDLNLELELEPEPEVEAESAAVNDVDQQAPEKDSDSLLNKIQQAVWTLEWEVTEDSIRNLKSMLENLVDEVTATDPGFVQVVSEMIQVLSDMERDAENVPTSAPVALKKGVEYLMAAASDEAEPDNLRKLLDQAVSELSAAFASREGTHESESPASVPGPVPDAGEQMESLDLEIEMEPESEPEPEMKPEAEPAEPQIGGKSEADTATSVPTSPKPPQQAEQKPSVGPSVEMSDEPGKMPSEEEKESSKILNEHLNALRDCVKRIRPVEDLLAKTKGMKKLHLFLGDLRTRLERQVDLLEHGPLSGIPFMHSSIKGEASAGLIPDVAREGKEAETDRPHPEFQKREETKCPWRELFLARRGSITVGLLLEEVAFHGTVPFWVGSGLMNQEKIALKRLKPWPWSRLSSMVQGPLLAVKEKELAQMEVPVMQLTDPASNAESGHNVVILSRGTKNAALFLDSEPDYFSLKAEHTYDAADSEDFLEGVLRVDGNTVHIISVTRMNQTKP